ncbi:pyridoxamine 5'-phosphate oxidase family protein [Rhodococcus sp. HNM0563]|uniref:pyridoxamine 5'-phosphate oxidase family protein n=1 Tax=unclassified Rhodococcus (in: high G+C Gram-positive bacteria) TaxID=192944 RepID=UPI00146B6C1B|nr:MULTISPECIES: pyridoxamine 5'-phosphate oxidase family protein [unclassified Rhodococcus (in: high G+C Gram-positive bacteria)]MCK0091155.1 pyridoxamine 5'-phosphate oxidase family protein [Rhodococcus sp. F64268]NLU60805.1 pyridoxamine 5'-phosphate oxidase family protein [Rhodococcus sp. HNM0563]
MSIKVDLDALDAALGDFEYAYLLTTGTDAKPHAVAVTPVLVDGVFRIGEPGRRTGTNAQVHPGVSLVYPPAIPGGYSLIVDGEAELDGSVLHVRPTSGVLHRPATAEHPAINPGCDADCRPLAN